MSRSFALGFFESRSIARTNNDVGKILVLESAIHNSLIN
jgi:hypothetical protein